MKSAVFPLTLTWLFACLLILGCGGRTPTVDLGDGSTGNLIWGVSHYAFEKKDTKKSLAYADKMVELHGAEARQMQASLSGYPVTDPPEATYKYKTLNLVGFAVLVKGKLLMEQGDRAGAEEAYISVVQDYGYAQVQDLGEWQGRAASVPRDGNGFLKIADVAKLRLAEIRAGKN